MTGGRAPRDEKLPVFDALETIEAETVFGPDRFGRRGPGPARGAGIAAALLVVLVAGIALGSLPKGGDPTTRPSASADLFDGAIAANPTADLSPCRAPTVAHLPTLVISSAELGVARYASFTSGYRADPNSPQLPAPAWQVPRLDAALRIQQPVDGLQVGSDLETCMGEVVLTYARTDTQVEQTSLAYPGDGVYEPPVHNLTVRSLPPGDWVLRAETHFQALDEPAGAEIVTFSFFRLIVGDVPVASDAPTITPSPPAPWVTPATPCGPGIPKPDIEVLALGGRGEPVPGAVDLVPAPPLTPPGIPVVVVGLGDALEIAIVGNQCAASWDIQMIDPVSGGSGFLDQFPNPLANQAVGTQNHWQVTPIPDEVLVAKLDFAGGPSIVRSWNVKIQPFKVPAAFVVAQNGTRFQASAGCGLALKLANGYSASDSCGSIGYRPTAAALHVAAFQPIQFDIPDWNLLAWNAECGAMQATDPETFTNLNGCRLGGAAVTDVGAPLLTPATFVLPPGDTVVRISVTGVNAKGDQFSLPFYAHVIAR